MGKSTKQFVNKGCGIRSRKYLPDDAVITGKKSNGNWEAQRGLVFQIFAIKSNNELQEFCLTKEETAGIGKSMFEFVNVSEKHNLVRDYLTTLTDGELLGIFASVVNKRTGVK